MSVCVSVSVPVMFIGRVMCVCVCVSVSVPAIFIGLNLHKSFVPSWATWVITAFILFHLIIELLLEIHGCLNARKQQRMSLVVVVVVVVVVVME